jgi:uncharacterized protein (TIGR03083 family)
MTQYDHFAEAAQAYAALVAQITPDQWDGPGLGVWDLRALVGHGARALITVDTYLDRPAQLEALDSPVAYLAATSGATDPAAVAERGRQAGEALGAKPARTVQELVDRVLPRVRDAGDPLIETIGGGMRLSAYLPTRTFELVVHGLDVAHAAGLAQPGLSTSLLSAMTCLASAAAVRHDHGPTLLLALTGRAPLPAGFCVV